MRVVNPYRSTTGTRAQPPTGGVSRTAGRSGAGSIQEVLADSSSSITRSFISVSAFQGQTCGPMPNRRLGGRFRRVVTVRVREDQWVPTGCGPVQQDRLALPYLLAAKDDRLRRHTAVGHGGIIDAQNLLNGSGQGHVIIGLDERPHLPLDARPCRQEVDEDTDRAASDPRSPAVQLRRIGTI